MTDVSPRPVSIDGAIEMLTFLPDRTPDTTDEASSDSFAQLAIYRDGGIYVGHWAGKSEWERHPVADEIVMVVEGEATITFLAEDEEHSQRLVTGDLFVVPQGIWHRLETPDGVKVLSVTPQPSDHETGSLPAG